MILIKFFTYIFTIVFCTVLVGCGAISDSTDTSSSSTTPVSSNCSAVLFDSLPVDNLVSIVPLGNSNPRGGHTFPTPHNYVYFDEQGNTDLDVYNVMAPGDITLTSIETMTYTHKTTGVQSADYSINFKSQTCSSVIGYYKHVKGLESSLEALLESISKSCNAYDAGDQNVERCNYSFSHKVSSGTVIGTVGGVGQVQANFDFGVADKRTRLDFLDQNYYWSDFYYMTCPWDYYSAEFKATYDIVAKFGIKEQGLDFVSRQGEPACGVFMQDVAGTAKGNWLLPTQTSFEKEDYHIALIESNYDAAKAMFSIGSDSGLIANNQPYRSEFSPNPDETSFIGQDFANVVPGNVYCYSSSDDESYKISLDSENSSEGNEQHIRILLYLEDDTTLKIKVDDVNTSCEGENIPSIGDFNDFSPVSFERDV